MISPNFRPQIKFWLIVAFFPLLFFSKVLMAEDIYISQTSKGENTGADCANSHSAVWFNNAANWVNPKQLGKIGPGDTVHLCGTISSELTAHGSGSSGSPIIIFFEPNAKISMPTSDTNNGCLGLSGLSYIIVDGGSNGIIENTANGTELAEQAASVGIVANPCDNCEIKNLTICNMYVHTSVNDTIVDQTMSNAIHFSGSNILIHNNKIHDVGWALYNSYGNDSNIQIYNNDIYNTDHGIAIGGYGAVFTSNIKIYNNHIHDYANWDTVRNAYHHDGIHLYGTPPAKATDVWIYDNLFDGDTGENITGHIFMEYGSSPWTDASGTAKVFNNVLMTTHEANYALLLAGGGETCWLPTTQL